MSKEISINFFSKNSLPIFAKNNSWKIQLYYEENGNSNLSDSYDYVIYHYYCQYCQSLRKVKVYKYEVPIYDRNKYICEVCKNDKFIDFDRKHYLSEKDSFDKDIRSHNILVNLKSIDILKIEYEILNKQNEFIIRPYTFIPTIEDNKIDSLLYEYKELSFLKEIYKEEFFKKELIDDIKNIYNYSDVNEETILQVFIKNYVYDNIDFYTKINNYSYLQSHRKHLFECFLRNKYTDFNFLLIDDIMKDEYSNIEDYFDFVRNYTDNELLKNQFKKQFQITTISKEYNPQADFIIFRTFKSKDSIRKLISNRNKDELFEKFYFITLDFKKGHLPIIILIKLFIEMYSEKEVCKYLLEENINKTIEVLTIGSNIISFISKSTLYDLLIDKNNIYSLNNELKRINSSLLKNIEITFPFAKYNDLSSLKIYKYTIDSLLDTDSEKLLHIDKENSGEYYDSKIDSLLCLLDKTKGNLNYPSILINGKNIFDDKSIYIDQKSSNIYLIDNNGFKYDIEKFRKMPPCRLSNLRVIIQKDIIFSFIE